MSGSSVDAFYHATMYKIEKKNQFRKKQIKKFAPISHKYKKIALSNNKEKLNSVFKAKRIQEMKHPRFFDSDKDFHEYIKRFPLYKCFEGNISINDYFPCLLFDNQKAWFYKDEQGSIRYYTKVNKGIPISLDVIDLLEILYGINSFEAKSLFLQWTGASIKDTFYENALRTRYLNNHAQFSQLMSSRSDFNKLLMPLNIVYEEMLKIGISPNYLTTTAYEFEVFFVSTRYLEARLGTLHYSNISRILNMLNGLGFIHKVEISELPSATQKRIVAWTKAMGYTKPVSFFKIPDIESELEMIKERIVYAIGKKITYRKATTLLKSDIDAYLMGETTVSETTYITDVFASVLDEYGYVSKTLLLQQLEGAIKKNQIEDIWKELLEEHRCIYIKPNKAMKAHYNLSNLEYIAIKK